LSDSKGIDVLKPIFRNPDKIQVDRISLVLGDFREEMEKLQDNSISMIFTDPPYDEKHISLYEDLARIASKKLCPGGSLIAYAGHYALPRIFTAMEKYLRYWWLLGIGHQNRYSRLMGKNVYVAWKPLVWFVKKYHGVKEFVIDFFQSRTPDKSFHEWAQSETEAAYYISRICPPDGIVVDPFAGSGTTLIAANSVGRRAIGYEISAEHYASSIKRIKDVTAQIALF